MLLHHMMAASGAAVEPVNISEVFGTFLFDGTSSIKAVTTNIDVKTEGGCAVLKNRNATSGGQAGGAPYVPVAFTPGLPTALFANMSNASFNGSVFFSNTTSVNIEYNGYTEYNYPNHKHVVWVFRQAEKFYKQRIVTHASGVNDTYDLSSLGNVGMVWVKRTDSAGDWFVWHRSIDGVSNLMLNTTTTVETYAYNWIDVSGTTLTITSGLPAGTYQIFAWAHDASASSVIKCGMCTTDSSGYVSEDVGFSCQWLLTRAPSVTSNWIVQDTARGWSYVQSSTDTKAIFLNTNVVEQPGVGPAKAATGFSISGGYAHMDVVYMAIAAA